jgi:ectoine hydroxylase-related dioxygenase (phytanoyl-CoA dioxygenase family)
MTVHAHIDVWNDDMICGWAIDESSPDPVEIVIEIGGRFVGRLQADRFRKDLGRQCSFQINCNFLPHSMNSQITLRVPRNGAVFSRDAYGASPPANDETHSLYGGLWIDRSSWSDVLERKMRQGVINDELAEQIRAFVRDGYLVIPRAVDDEIIERVNEDVERVWSGEIGGVLIETHAATPGRLEVIPANSLYRYGATKLLDVFSRVPAARAAAAAKPIFEFLTAVFEEPPRAFQQLHLTMGSQQPIHKDTAYVKIDSNPLGLAASWIALEDITPGTGELEYFVGSHRAPDFVFGGLSKWMEHSPNEHSAFLQSLQDDSGRFGQRLERFIAKRGDALIWHADLAHGGSPVTQPGLTRKSLVTHYTGESCLPFYMRQPGINSVVEHGMTFSSQYTDMTL